MSLPLPKRVPEPGFYYHYKHDPNGSVENYAYEVVGIGFHTEKDARPGEEHYMIYRPLYREASVYKASEGGSLPYFDARPLEMWMTNEGKTFPRFEKITDPAVIAELKKMREEMY